MYAIRSYYEVRGAEPHLLGGGAAQRRRLVHMVDQRGGFRVIERLTLGQQPGGVQTLFEEFVAFVSYNFV